MKTQNELQKMTDQQLTFELACLVFGESCVRMANHGKVGVSSEIDVGYISINDWNWIMPLAVEHDVTYNITYCLAGGGQVFTAMSIDKEDTHSDYSDTLQRAIAICLVLKMQEDAE